MVRMFRGRFHGFAAVIPLPAGEEPETAGAQVRSGSAAAAAGPAAAAPAAHRRGAKVAAADRDRGQQFHRVVVAGRTGTRGRGLAHRAGHLERVAAGAAAVLLARHDASLSYGRPPPEGCAAALPAAVSLSAPSLAALPAPLPFTGPWPFTAVSRAGALAATAPAPAGVAATCGLPAAESS